MHVAGLWTAVGAVITGLIIADVLFNSAGANSLLKSGGNVATRESSLLAGRKA